MSFNFKHIKTCLACLAAILMLMTSCREEQVIFIPEEVEITAPQYTSVQGFYLLNEGDRKSVV